MDPILPAHLVAILLGDHDQAVEHLPRPGLEAGEPPPLPEEVGLPEGVPGVLELASPNDAFDVVLEEHARWSVAAGQVLRHLEEITHDQVVAFLAQQLADPLLHLAARVFCYGESIG